MKKKSAGLNIRFFVLLFVFIIYVFPFIMVLINSLKQQTDIIRNPLSLLGDHGITFSNFVEAAEKMNFFQALGNSIFITFISTALIVLFSSMAAYIICRKQWKACKILFALMILSLAIPFQVLMIPLVSIYGGIFHLLNHRFTLIFMHIGFCVSTSTFLFYGSIKSTIPLELEEAASIDGCGQFQIFRTIVFPLLKPTIATTIIINALNIWNDYLLPSLILADNDLKTLPVATRVFYGAFSADLGLLMAALVLLVLPILILYLFLQKHIIEGVVAGAVKG